MKLFYLAALLPYDTVEKPKRLYFHQHSDHSDNVA